MNQAATSFLQEANINKLYSPLTGKPGLPFLIVPTADSIPLVLHKKIALLEKQLETERIFVQKKIVAATRKAIVNERKRIGQELHDNINQLLVCASLYFNQLNAVDVTGATAKAKGNEMQLMAINEIRKLSHSLAGAVDNCHDDLIGNIRYMIETFQHATQITVHFINNTGDKTISRGKSLTLYRILQEQLKNILLHSKASTVTIVLECKNNSIHFKISDDGQGMSTDYCTTGIGLSNIKERVKQHKGTFEIITSPGKGFTMHIYIPVGRVAKQTALPVTPMN